MKVFLRESLLQVLTPQANFSLNFSPFCRVGGVGGGRGALGLTVGKPELVGLSLCLLLCLQCVKRSFLHCNNCSGRMLQATAEEQQRKVGSQKPRRRGESSQTRGNPSPDLLSFFVSLPHAPGTSGKVSAWAARGFTLTQPSLPCCPEPCYYSWVLFHSWKGQVWQRQGGAEVNLEGGIMFAVNDVTC